jgi:hypothetical protein
MRIKYKDFSFVIILNELAGNLGWSSEVLVERDHGGWFERTPFVVRGRFSTSESAIDAALSSGMRAVDGGFRPTAVV